MPAVETAGRAAAERLDGQFERRRQAEVAETGGERVERRLV